MQTASEYELDLRRAILCSLRGVGEPVASAVLGLCFPEEYAVIDFRVWRELFNENRRVFSIPDHRRYMRRLRPLADEPGFPVQEVDHLLWKIDRREYLLAEFRRFW
ncbi:MAG: hypothetical protein ACE5LH_06760 [Fidelibacterota bacterium]